MPVKSEIPRYFTGDAVFEVARDLGEQDKQRSWHIAKKLSASMKEGGYAPSEVKAGGRGYVGFWCDLGTVGLTAIVSLNPKRGSENRYHLRTWIDKPLWKRLLGGRSPSSEEVSLWRISCARMEQVLREQCGATEVTWEIEEGSQSTDGNFNSP